MTLNQNPLQENFLRTSLCESTKVTKKRKREIMIIHGRPQKFFQGGQGQHFAYHFQIADDQCSL